MRFAPTFALFSSLFSVVTAHAITHRSRTLSERQYRQPRPRADLLDICVSLNGAEDGLLGYLLGILDLNVDLCLCLKDLDIYLGTDVTVEIAGLKASLAAIIKDKGTQCGDLPAHAHRVCSNANPCHFSCDSGYVEQNGICVCAAPTKDCNGKCAYSCASSVPRSPEPRLITAAPEKRTIPSFQGSVFARVAKRPLHIDTCDLLNIFALSDIARVQVDLPILNCLNALLQALKLGGQPATCPSPGPATHIDLCKLLEGLSLGSIKFNADVNLGSVLNGLLNELLGLLHLGGHKLSCRQSKSSAAVSCALSQRSLVARTTDIDLCPLLESLGLGDTLKVKVGLLAALGAGGFPSCGAKTFSSLALPTSDSLNIIGIVDSLVDTLVAMKNLLTSLGCGCSGGSDLSNALEALVVLVNQILTALGNVTDDLGKYISSSQHLLAELQCSLKSYSSMDALPKDTSATVDKLVSACDVLLTVLEKTLAGLESCGCKEDQQMVQNVKKHIADNPYITPTPRINPSDVAPTHDRPAEQGPDSEPCEYADDDLVTALLQSLGLDDLLGTSTADLVNDLLRSLLGGGALLSGNTLNNLVDGLGLGSLLGGSDDPNQLLKSLDGSLSGLSVTGGSDSDGSSSSADLVSNLLKVVGQLLDGIVRLRPLLQSLNLSSLSKDLLQPILNAVNDVVNSVEQLVSDLDQLVAALNDLLDALDGATSNDQTSSTLKSTLELTKSLVQGLIDLVDGLVDDLGACSCMKEQRWKDGVKEQLRQKATSLGRAS